VIYIKKCAVGKYTNKDTLMGLLQAVKREGKGEEHFERDLITNKLCGKKIGFYRRKTDVIKCFCENFYGSLSTMSVTQYDSDSHTCVTSYAPL
jgi:hypothetical protein